jgi:hypothetical protein
MWAQTIFLISEAQHVEYLIEIGLSNGVKVQTQDF